MIEPFLQDDSHGYSATTLTITRQWLDRLQDFLHPKSLLKASARQLAEWHRGLLWRPGPSGRNYSQNTVNQAVGAVRRFFRWARKQGLLREDPSLELRLKKVDPHHKPLLTPLEARKLLEAAETGKLTGTRDRALLGLLLETGISQGTCSRIDRNHLQLDTETLLTRVRGKRQLHSLSHGLVTDLKSYLEWSRPQLANPGEQALFVSQKGSRLTGPAIRQVVLRWTAVAGVPRP